MRTPGKPCKKGLFFIFKLQTVPYLTDNIVSKHVFRQFLTKTCVSARLVCSGAWFCMECGHISRVKIKLLVKK